MEVSLRLLERLHWLGHASFRLDGPPTLYFDPWHLRGRLPKADVILVSHDHHDHCSPADIRRISGPGTIIVANPSAAAKLVGDVRVLSPGDSVAVAGVVIEAVPAYNIGKSFHPRQADHVGYVVTVDGERLYFAGDTDRIPEMRAIRCDVALLPVGGTYTMTAAEAAQAAADLEAKVVVPMHYGAGGIGSPEDGARFCDLVPGKALVLDAE